MPVFLPAFFEERRQGRRRGNRGTLWVWSLHATLNWRVFTQRSHYDLLRTERNGRVLPHGTRQHHQDRRRDPRGKLQLSRRGGLPQRRRDFDPHRGGRTPAGTATPHRAPRYVGGLRLLRLPCQAGGRGAGGTLQGADSRNAARRRRKVRPNPGRSLRGFPGGEPTVPARDGAAEQVALRDDDFAQGARDAPSRPAHAGAAHARHGAATDASHAGTHRRHESGQRAKGVNSDKNRSLTVAAPIGAATVRERFLGWSGLHKAEPYATVSLSCGDTAIRIQRTAPATMIPPSRGPRATISVCSIGAIGSSGAAGVSSSTSSRQPRPITGGAVIQTAYAITAPASGHSRR